MSVTSSTGVARSTPFSDLPLDCVMRIMTFSGNPSHARVCKLWRAASEQSYLWILNTYREDAKVSRFISADIGNLTSAQCAQAVQQIYRSIIGNAKALQLPVELITGFHQSPLNLRPIVDAIENMNLVRLFSRLKSIIPENERPDFKGDHAQKATDIRIWMENHQIILNEVTSFSLDYLELMTLPPEICKLENLQWLHLSSNRFKELPLEIVKLKNLQWLDLSVNQLTTLPPEIGRLVNLKKLYLHQNQLTFLPPEIGRLVNLQCVGFAHNRLTSFPAEIGWLKNLQWFNIQHNQFTVLPQEIWQLAKLPGINMYAGNNPLVEWMNPAIFLP